MIKPGDKVVCIHAEWSLGLSYQTRRGIPCPLVKGEVYTVIGFEHWPLLETTKRMGRKTLVLAEVTNPTGCDLAGFAASRFRKLIDISQGMEQLKAIARNPTKGIEV
jgi:hypothetical protein